MLNKFIDFFVQRHLLTNMFFIAVFVVGIFSWSNLKREEMPDVTFDWLRIYASYPGATAEEVEHFVTRELEDAVRGIDGVYRFHSTASQGNTSVTVELEADNPNKDETVAEIRNAVLDARLPEDVRDAPSVRLWKTSKKAIIDIALIHKEVDMLDAESRRLLQKYARALEDQLMSLKQVNSVRRRGFLSEAIEINVDPAKMSKYKIPLNNIIRVIRENHARQPAGNIEAKDEPKVTISAQLDSVEKLNSLYVQAGFAGQAISLSEIAEVTQDFGITKQISRVNGRGAVILNVVKSSSAGILEALAEVEKTVNTFINVHTKGLPIEIVLLDDESIDVRNRLSIIAVNGSIGFTLVVIALFIFLSKRGGFWVALGIPFTICFTMAGCAMIGYTINNITLAAVIIVMGIVADDAIVIAENIIRRARSGLDSRQAAVRGTAEMFMPIWASIITTCVAFIPLYFFSGRFGRLNHFMPTVIFLMLGASLLEALFILPGHMHMKLPNIAGLFGRKKSEAIKPNEHWFDKAEDRYGRLLEKVLPHKYLVFAAFILLLVFSGWIVKKKMKFVMFPREETREISISCNAAADSDRFATAAIAKRAEAILEPHLGKEVIGYRTEIARSRHGRDVEENRFRIRTEIVAKEDRDISADELSALWKEKIEKIDGLDEVTVQKSHWGHSSGSAIEVVVSENDDRLRHRAADRLAELMKEHAALDNVEIDRPMMIKEYKIDFKREKLKRLSISPSNITATFRAALAGRVLYELPDGDEEIEVRLSISRDAKTSIEELLDVPVENNRDYLVPLRDVVSMEETETPNSISRQDGKRTTTVYADLKPEAKLTPLEIAAEMESDIFPRVVNTQPTTTLAFSGEIYDSRESKNDFRNAILMVVLLIFAILALLFNSVTKPLIIMLAIPFGVVGVVLAFLLHGKVLFGFFAAIGCLGMTGVVVNDSIIMVTRLVRRFDPSKKENIDRSIARIAQTRLKAVMLTTITTVSAILPTAYGFAGYDAMLSEMMLAMAWGLIFGTLITLLLVPCLYSAMQAEKPWQAKLLRRMKPRD